MVTGDHTQCLYCSARVHSVLNVLDNEKLADLSTHKSCSTYKKGQYIFSENGMPYGLFCVNKGKIKLIATGFDGKDQILRLAKEGDILGYRALISGERYHCSAIALEDCSICIIDKNYFYQSIQDNFQLLFEIVKKISGDLKTAEEHIMSLSQKNLRERMAEALLFLKATYGFTTDGQTLNVMLSREEIADYTGTSTESAIRQLSEFSHDKIIELTGKKIKITDLPKLIKTANIND